MRGALLYLGTGACHAKFALRSTNQRVMPGHGCVVLEGQTRGAAMFSNTQYDNS